MSLKQDWKRVSRQVPIEVRRSMDRAIQCLEFGCTAIREARPAVIFVVESLEAGQLESDRPTWHKRIKLLKEREAIDALAAESLHFYLNVRDHVEYKGAEISPRHAELYLGLLVAAFESIYAGRDY